MQVGSEGQIMTVSGSVVGRVLLAQEGPHCFRGVVSIPIMGCFACGVFYGN